MDSAEAQFRRSLQHAQMIARAYALTPDDVRSLSRRFWDFHRHPILSLDGATSTLLTIQLNLAAGTLAKYVDKQPYLREVLDRVLSFDVCAQFCLTELHHGLDAIHLETTATVQNDGTFVLHTPHPGAAKYMPPTGPFGIPVIAVVFARMISHEGKDLGIKGFLVELNDGIKMFPGVTAKLLPPRGGAKPVLHCLTTFDHVRLPASALLGRINASEDQRLDFFDRIYRVAVGTLALSGPVVQTLPRLACIVTRYSQRRCVTGGMPLISYKTQYGPILTTLAQYFVLDAFWHEAVNYFSDASGSFWMRHGMVTVFKNVAIQHAEAAVLVMSTQVGAQGLFGVNGVCGTLDEIRGVAIAEGDLLGISVRLVSEILLGRYALPPAGDSEGMLAKREVHLISQAEKIVSSMQHHRSEEFNRMILPRCKPIVQSIGHRMAYEAASRAGVDPIILELYLTSIFSLDSAWFSEQAGVKADEQFMRHDRALSAALPYLEEWIEKSGIEEYLDSPLLSESRWEAFVQSLPFAPFSVDRNSVLRARL